MASYQDIQTELAKVRQDYGQRVANYPQFEKDLRQKVYGSDKVLPTLRQTRDDAISQLWDVDKRMAQKYANPDSNLFIKDPYKREQLASGEHQSVLKAVTGTDRAVEERSKTLDDILERGVKIFELGLTAKEKEQNMLMDELNAQLSIDKQKSSTAGNIENILPQLLGMIPKAPTEAKPEVSKQQIDRMIATPGTNWKSPGGQWVFDQGKKDWVPFRFPEEQGMEGLSETLQPFLKAAPLLSMFPDQSKDLTQKLFNQIIKNTVPEASTDKQEKWTTEKRSAMVEMLDDLNAYNTKQDQTPQQLYQQLIKAYPDLSPDEIYTIMKNLNIFL